MVHMHSMTFQRVSESFRIAYHPAMYCVVNTFQTVHLLVCKCLSDYAFYGEGFVLILG